jgi:class 3 adenylate cyclase
MHAKGRKLLRTLKDSGLLASLIRTLTASSLSILLEDTVVYTWEQDEFLDPATPTHFLTSGRLSLVYQTDHAVAEDILNLCQTVLAALDHHTTLQYELSSEVLEMYRDQNTLLDAARTFSKILDRNHLLEQAIDFISHWTDAFIVNQGGSVVASNVRDIRVDRVMSVPWHDQASIDNTPAEGGRPRLYFPIPVEAAPPLMMVLTRKEPFRTVEVQRLTLMGSLLASYLDALHYLRERQMLSRYMPQTVVEGMLQNPTVDLGGTERQVTVLFTDIRDFTGITQRLGAARTVSLLNMVYEVIVEDIRTFKGIVDKYMGDGVLAIFGTPIPNHEHATMAYRAARQIHERLQLHQSRFFHPVQVGITLSTGDVISGNIGVHDRMDYTVIGNCVNYAVKLQAFSKKYTCPILMDRATYNALSEADKKDCQDLDQILYGVWPGGAGDG